MLSAGHEKNLLSCVFYTLRKKIFPFSLTLSLYDDRTHGPSFHEDVDLRLLGRLVPTELVLDVRVADGFHVDREAAVELQASLVEEANLLNVA